MSMNYVGSVSIIDRGDAPAKAIIDKNTRSLAQRVADETKDELNKVMDRVDNIYVSYEMSTQTMFENPRGSPSVEYVEDIKELEEIIKDTVKKKKYQQQVTIFIVGFQDVSAQKMQLLQQVNQFFLENAKPEEEEIEEKMDIDLEEASNKVNESLSTAEELAKKLSDLNQDIIEWLVNYANTKASNKGKKRLEKNLEAAKNDMNNLSEKLLNLQTELEEKDDKMQQLVKQLEVKTQEAVRFKTAAEVAKKSAQDNENHTSTLQDEITRRDEKIQELRTKLSRLEINLTESQFDNQMSLRKLDNSSSQTKLFEILPEGSSEMNVIEEVETLVEIEKLSKLQEEVNQKKMLVTEAEREMEKLHKEQLHEVKKQHFEEIEEVKREHKEELSQLTELLESVQRRLAQSEQDAQQAFDESDEMRSKLLEMQLRENSDSVRKPTSQKQQQQQPNVAHRPSSGKSVAELSTGDEDQTRPESRPSTKDTKSSKKSDSKPVKTTAKSPSRVTQGKTVGRKDFADASIQDEGGDANRATVEKSNEPSRQATRQSKTLEPVVETGDRQEFSNAFDLDDEDAWASVPPNQVIGRFAQYRQLGLSKIKEVEDQLNITLTKTHRKVNSLKAQFNDHKGKWEAERKILIEQVEQAQKLQTDAEKEADAAMTQLEEFINEQEKLEDEEEVKRQEVLKTMSRPSTTAKKPAPTIEEQKPEAASQDAEKPKADEAEGERIQSDTSEQELKKLMQQTDDAKSRPGSSVTSEGDIELAPWLTPDYIKGKEKERQEIPSDPKTETQTDLPASHLTSVADSELEKIMPPPEKPERQASSGDTVELQRQKSQPRLPVDIIKGEKERLRSRASSKASRPPRIVGSHFDEKDEDVFTDDKPEKTTDNLNDDDSNDSEEEEEELMALAPWLLKKSPVKVPQSRQSSRMASSTQEMESENIPEQAPLVSPEKHEEIATAPLSQHSSNIVMEEASVKDNGKNDVDSSNEKLERMATRSNMKSQQRSRQSSVQNVQDSRSTMKEDDYEESDEENQTKRKVRRKHKKKADSKPKDEADETNQEIDDETVTEPKDKQIKKHKKNKEKKETKAKPAEQNADDKQGIREEDSRRSVTRQGKRRSHEKNDHDKMEGNKAEKTQVGEEVLAEKKAKSKSKHDHVDSEINSSEEEDESFADEDLETIELKEEATDGEDMTLATDEEKVKLLAEKSKLKSPRSNLSEGKNLSEGRKSTKQTEHSKLDLKLGDINNDSDDKVYYTNIHPQPSDNIIENNDNIITPTRRLESESMQDDNASMKTPYTRQMSQPPTGRIEPESMQGDNASMKTPYTRQMSQPPTGRIEPESMQGDDASMKTPYTRQMSQPPTGRIEPESMQGDDASMKTPYTRQMSQPPTGRIEPESIIEDNDNMKTPYTRQMSQPPTGRIEAESMQGENDSMKTPYTRQMSHQLTGRLESESMLGDVITPFTQRTENAATDSKRSSLSKTQVQSPESKQPAVVREVVTAEVIMKPPTAEVDEALEKNSRQSGAISAPPAVEPGDVQQAKRVSAETPREDNESRPVTPKVRTTSANQSMRNLNHKKPDTPKEAFRTPRSSRTGSASSAFSEESIVLGREIETDIDEGVAMDIAKNQSDALSNMKNMMLEENLSIDQQKTLDSLRSAIKSIASTDQKLNEKQLQRTVTILSLASQLAHESVELGVMPDSVFNSFGSMDSRSISSLSDKKSVDVKKYVDVKRTIASMERQRTREKQRQAETQKEEVFRLVPEKPCKQPKSKSPRGNAPQQKLEENRPLKDSEQVMEVIAPKPGKKERVLSVECNASGSMNLEYGSSRADSFSASLPRTITSSEWQKMSLHDPFSPEPVKPQREDLKQRNNTVESDEKSGQLAPPSSRQSQEINVVISPKKKSRVVTKEEMLYGDRSAPSYTRQKSAGMMEILGSALIKTSRRVFSIRDPTALSGPKTQFAQTPKSAPSNNFPSAKTARKLSSSSDAQKPSTPSAQSESIDVLTSPQPVAPTTPQTIISMTTQPNVQPVAVSPLTAPTPGTAVSDIPRPPSISSIQAVPVSSPIPIPSPIQTTHKGTQTDLDMPAIEKEPIQGTTEEEIRESSAKSRASLRSQFKSRLDETRQAVEERRTKSPVISIPSQKSLDDELIIEDDDDDLPIPDDQKAGEVLMKEETFEAGTSPPPGNKLEKQLSFASRHSVNLGEHPVVKEYLRAYTGIHNFKDAISRILEDKDQMSASQILADLDNILFNKDEKVIPQIENMTENIYYVLNEVSQVVNSVLQNDRGPVVSSLMMGMSRDPTQRTIIREKSGVTTDQLFTRASQRSVASKLDSASTERQQYRDLQEQYEKLQNRMADEAKKFDDQQKHNVVVMMEMQDTINQLQRELSNLGKQPRRPASENMSTAGGSQPTESAVMFTRLDSERNAKIMKKAVNEKKLDANRYKEAIVQMDDYVNLPGQRLAHLVRKYVHHCRMKEIEENVQNSNSLNENVFEVLDKMEALQNQRAKHWADKMDEMGMERMKLANILMETFDDIERESGIFLIKPMYSYRGREVKERYSGKISRPFRPQRALSPLRDLNSAYAPAPTPASNMRPVRMHQAKEAAMLGQSQDQIQVTRTEGSKPLEGDNVGLMGSSVRYIGSQPKATWSMADSQMRVDPGPQGAGMQGNTPRILELDINRMMIGQNTISASIPGLSNDRLVNASNSNLRSYMTVNRPTGPSSAGKSDRPLSGSRHLDSPGPPPSPTNRSSSTTKRVRMSDIDVPSVMSTAQPLPPIGRSPTPGSNAGSSKGRQSPTRIPVGENSPSPPGSRDSLRHSPVGMSETEISSPIK